MLRPDPDPNILILMRKSAVDLAFRYKMFSKKQTKPSNQKLVKMQWATWAVDKPTAGAPSLQKIADRREK